MRIKLVWDPEFFGCDLFDCVFDVIISRRGMFSQRPVKEICCYNNLDDDVFFKDIFNINNLFENF